MACGHHIREDRSIAYDFRGRGVGGTSEDLEKHFYYFKSFQQNSLRDTDKHTTDVNKRNLFQSQGHLAPSIGASRVEGILAQAQERAWGTARVTMSAGQGPLKSTFLRSWTKLHLKGPVDAC